MKNVSKGMNDYEWVIKFCKKNKNNNNNNVLCTCVVFSSSWLLGLRRERRERERERDARLAAPEKNGVALLSCSKRVFGSSFLNPTHRIIGALFFNLCSFV